MAQAEFIKVQSSGPAAGDELAAPQTLPEREYTGPGQVGKAAARS